MASPSFTYMRGVEGVSKRGVQKGTPHPTLGGLEGLFYPLASPAVGEGVR